MAAGFLSSEQPRARNITNPTDVAPAAAVSSFLNLISTQDVTGFRCARIPPNFVSAARSLAEVSNGDSATALLGAISSSDMDPERMKMAIDLVLRCYKSGPGPWRRKASVNA